MENNTFQFSNLKNFPEITHGISLKAVGNMKFQESPNEEKVINARTDFVKNLKIAPENVVVAKLVHGKNITMVKASDRGKGFTNYATAIDQTDGLITNEPNVFLMLTVADCLPILAYDPVKKIVGLIHAGWRGILHGIVNEMVAKFEELGSCAEDLVIGIGPSLCQRHFVVKNDVRERFEAKYPRAVLVRNHDGYVDLRRCVTDDLIRLGVSKANLEVSKECTKCNNYYFSSYRFDKEQTIFQAAIIGLNSGSAKET